MNNSNIYYYNYLNQFEQILNRMQNRMLHSNWSGNITKDFIVCMIPHHEAAIQMCENLLMYTKNYQLMKIAKNIMRTQTEGIRQMIGIYETTPNIFNAYEDVERYRKRYIEITKRMIEKMKDSNQGQNIDFAFISEMIPHHEGAIQLCQNVLQYHIDPRLEKVARTIIRQQTKGIEELKQVKETR